MKIVNSVRKVYQDQLEINNKLKQRVDQLLISVKQNQWHYVSRIKSMASFALKLETGRVENPNALEDFFACTIVVENTKAIKNARTLLKKHFKIHQERPENQNFTKKESSSFIFDDLRLYASLLPTSARPKGPVNDVKFEVQIKTFLQHAWAIATHDLVYKSDDLSWTKQRVAYQVKAMLENAEISIEKADSVKKLPGIPSDNPKIQFQNKIKQFLLKSFDQNTLPTDLVRLIGNIEYLIKVLKIDLTEIEDCLDKDSKNGLGVHTLNLSPYLIIVQSIINRKPKKVESFLKSKARGNYNPKIFIPLEVDLKTINNDLSREKIISP